MYPHGNTSLNPLELGASIFVSANKNLWRASDEFNLTRLDFETGDTTGVWDGERFIITVRVLPLRFTRPVYSFPYSSLGVGGGTQSKSSGAMGYFLQDEQKPCKLLSLQSCLRRSHLFLVQCC